jgi:hypothetical protein
MIRTSRVFVYSAFCRITISTAFVCLFLASVALCSPEQIKFTFNPPAGLVGTETVRSIITTDFGHGAKHSQAFGYKSTISYTKNADNYLVSRTSITTQGYDGRKLAGDNPFAYIVGMAMQAPITYQLDSGGDCTRVYGIEEFFKLLEKRAAKDSSGQAVGALRDYQDALKTQMIADWNLLIAPFTYRTVHIGDMWRTSVERPLPTGGTVDMATKVRFLGWVKAGGKRWLKVRMDCSCSDVAALQRCLDSLYSSKAATDADRSLHVKVESFSVVGTDTRLIDPATMLYLGQYTNIETKFRASLNGQDPRSADIKQAFMRTYSYRNQTVASR